MAPPPPPDGIDPSQPSNPSWYDIPGQIEKAINTWLGDMVKSALQPVLHFVGSTLLSSPDLSDGRIAQVWTATLMTANALYVLFILAGGLIVMGHETVQTRYSAKEIAPRLVIGMIASNASLWTISQTVSLGNVLAQSLMNGQISSEGVGHVLVIMVVDKIFMPGSTGEILLILLGAVIAAMGLVLVVTYLIRAAVLIILTAGAPLAFGFHALPQTEGVAKLWWRAIFGCTATQLAQSFVLVTSVRVFFDPHATVILGLPADAGTLTDLLLCLCLFFILIKIPVWVHRVVFGRSPFGMTMAGRLGMSFLYYRMFMKLRGSRGSGARRDPPPRRHGVWNNTTRPRPPAPGTGLAAMGPRPGGGPGSSGLGGWAPEPPMTTAAQVWPTPPRPHGPPPPPALGPVRKPPLALPIGPTERLNRRHRATVVSPPPRGKQFGLFPPVERTPGATGGRTRQGTAPPTPPPAPSGPIKGQQPLFPNSQPRRRAPQAPPPGPTRLPLAPLFLSLADYEQEQQAPPKNRRTPTMTVRPTRTPGTGTPRPPTSTPPPETGA